MHIFASITALTLLILPEIVLAQPTQSLINLPFGAQNDFGSYINLLYGLSISAAALLAVIKIIIAGVKYMLTDVVTSKGDAIKEIKGALLGLLLIIGAVLILTVINPKLLNTNLDFDPQPMPAVQIHRPSVQATGGAGTTAGAGGATAGAGTTAGAGGAAAGAGAGTTAGTGAGSATAAFNPGCIQGGTPPTRTQGSVTYQYFNVKSCGFANIPAAVSYLRNEICRPNAVFNGGNDVYYCKQ